MFWRTVKRQLRLSMMDYLVGVLLLLGTNCAGFNIDTSRPITHSGPDDSLFGYSVALHRENGVNLLLAGAPRAQTTQPGVDRGGAVYRCPVSAAGCEQIPFDTLGQPENEDGDQIGSKSNQFFGATLQSSGPDGPVVACAPRRMWSVDEYNSPSAQRYLTGSCFVATDNFTDIRLFNPCEQPDEDTDRLGQQSRSYCQAGFSADVSQDWQLLIGGPGSFYWQGQIMSVDVNSPASFRLSEERNPIIYDNYYLGYKVARVRFGSGVYVVSEPRADYFVGKVSILDENFGVVYEILGDQMSAYFGHALVVTDVNADGLDDLIIGAPMFVDTDNLIDRWEVGRAYVYCQNSGAAFVEKATMTGTYPAGQFGFAIAALGDVNRDGFNDIAIAAPFAGDDNSGIVYIYQGRRKGVKNEASQILRPADFGLNLQSFGSSLSGGLDMDGNDYPDLLVGAYLSSTAVLVRSRPIVRIQKSLTFEPAQINLDTKDFRLPSGREASSFNVTTCFTPRGLDIPQVIDVKYSLQLDASLPTTPRAAFVLENSLDQSELTRKIRLTTDEEMCQKDLVYVKIFIQEKNLPIGVRLTYELAPEEATVSPALLATSDVPPILNDSPTPVVLESLLIRSTCKNYLCAPDLFLRATTNTERVAVGDDWTLRLDITVTNHGEDAYDASFQAIIPEGMTFVRVERTSADLSVTCSAEEDSGVVMCDIGNPFPEEYMLGFGMTIANDDLSGDDEELVIAMSVSSLNYEPQNLTTDNNLNVTVGVHATAELGLYGVSSPQQVLYRIPRDRVEIPDPKTEEEVGTEITHLYMLQNLGPSKVGLTTVQIYWPLVDADGDYLLYLFSAKMGTGEDCHVQGGVNPEGLEPEDGMGGSNSTEAPVVSTSEPSNRKRRQSEEAVPQVNFGETIECDQASDQCVVITCNVSATNGDREDGQLGLIRITSRLYEKTIIEKNYTNVLISSTANASVLTMPYMDSILPNTFPMAYIQATTQVLGQLQPPPPIPRPTVLPSEETIFPLWAYFVAIIGGVLLLTLIAIALWKCGFFKRKKIAPNDPQAAAQEHWENDVLIDEKE